MQTLFEDDLDAVADRLDEAVRRAGGDSLRTADRPAAPESQDQEEMHNDDQRKH